MKRDSQWSKNKSPQWKIIIFTGLFLIFGKSIGNKIGDWISSSQFMAMANQQIQMQARQTTGLSNSALAANNQLILEIKNDTQNDYIVAGKLKAGHLYFHGNSLLNGQTKTFIISAEPNKSSDAFGDIIFTSSPVNGANNTICQVVHVLNYDLKNADLESQPLKVNLSSIASRLDCKNNVAIQNELNTPDESY